jgi:class 3 adenylate cyclase
MSDPTPSLKQLNRTFIGSVLFIDIVGYSTRTVPDQLEMKELFNTMLAEAVQNVAPSDRIMVDTGDGAGIAFLGDPEDALFAALSLRDSIEAANIPVGEPGFVRMGINLGPLKVVRDINGHTNMIGDGVNDAQRVMSFADLGQVMVSHSYFDIISRFSRDYAQLFVYEGTRQDKHVREHEVYRFGPPKDHEDLTDKLRDRSRARHVLHDDVPESGIAAPASVVEPPPAKPSAPAPVVARSGGLRPGLIATAVGAVTLVGAVWSWTGNPEPQPIAGTAAPLSSEPEKGIVVRTKVESSKAADIRADVKLAAKHPEATPKSTQRATAQFSPTDVIDKSAKLAEPAAKPGTVKLAIQPWGEIYVDGGKRGVSPPMKSLNLAPGKHRIEIRNGDFAPYKETIEVKSGGESTVQYVF